MTYEMTGRIAEINRLRSSYSGNPRFEIVLVTSGTGDMSEHTGPDCQGDHMFRTFNTAADAHFSYTIGNKGLRANDIVTVTVGGRGTIVDIKSQQQ